MQSRAKLLPTSAAVNTATITAGPHAELMQTELHHIQTLTVMSEVFRRGMLEELQLDLECVAKVFPCLDPLLLFHKNLFGAMQDCKQAATQPENPRNYLIQQIGDVLLQQVGGGTPTLHSCDTQPHMFVMPVMTLFPPPLSLLMKMQKR